jgi:hypothetical protein
MNGCNTYGVNRLIRPLLRREKDRWKRREYRVPDKYRSKNDGTEIPCYRWKRQQRRKRKNRNKRNAGQKRLPKF